MDQNKNFVAYGQASKNVLIDRSEAKMIYKFILDNTKIKEKYYKAEGKIKKIRRIR